MGKTGTAMTLTIRRHILRAHQTAALRRLAFFGLTGLTTLAGAYLMFVILNANGLTALEIAALALFGVLTAWIAGAFWTAAAGFWICLRGGDPA
ncbi:MAG: glucan biosynthesis glucosyltransferase H, partial [Alphaproteobacteria bacterium]